MWSFDEKGLGPTTIKIIVKEEATGSVLSYRDVLALWVSNASFRAAFTSALKYAPFEAFFWETPPVTEATVSRPFEYVLVSAPEFLRVNADPGAFEEHFSLNSVVSFPNLGGDATLIVPEPVGPEHIYTHLAQFVRRGPTAQIDAFWECVGQTVLAKLGRAPLWLSTAGLGVSWLHLRLDSRPKYYRHAPYRTAPIA